MHFSRSIVAAMLALCLMIAPASGERRVALVVGNSQYHFANVIPNPSNDAHDIAAKLTALSFDVVRGTNLNEQSFTAKIREFAKKLRDADVALFYYAGHGVAVDGINYLIPTDARLQTAADLELETVTLAKVQRLMERRPRVNIIIFDACRNNPFARNISRSLGSRSALVKQGWAAVNPGAGTYISFATKPGDVASDGEGRNSPFTRALLRYIETPNVDIELMMRRVRRDVIKETAAKGRKQVPWANTSMTSSFFFSRGDKKLSRQIAKSFISTNKVSYAQGDKLKLEITPPQDCRLTLLNFDKTGRSCQLFPHESLADPVLRAGQPFVFPPKGSLTLGEVGQETFVAMCNATAAAKAAATRRTRSVGCSKGASDRNFNERTLELATFDPNDKGGAAALTVKDPARKHNVLRSSLTIQVTPK